MSSSPANRPTLLGHTPWANRDTAPIRAFLRTESASSGILVSAIVAALVWANIDAGSYDRVWRETLSITMGTHGVSQDLRTWVNSGLMTLFFLVVGLEARRELDLGDLRERRRFILPFFAGLFGMAVPAVIFVLINLGRGDPHGWGVAMSTDTALALGLVSLLGRNVPERIRVFLLTVFVVDDLASLVVIAIAYSKHISVVPLIVAVAVFLGFVVALRLGVNRPELYTVMGVVVWVAVLKSGIDPVVTGLAIGLSASAYSPAREQLEQASGLFQRFREQPTAELAREASTGLTATLSPNARLQRFYHPWASYVIVPLFALANAGVVVSGSILRHALTSPITLGIVAGYVIGKPVAVVTTSWLVTRMSRGRVRPTIGWGAVVGSGTIAGIGFTVSFLIATLAFDGRQLAEAKLGILSAAVIAALSTAGVFRLTNLLPEPRRTRALLGDADQIVDLAVAVDSGCDHIRGPETASVTVVEYGDFQCPYCGQAELAVREELRIDSDVRFVWRHLPLTDVHPAASRAAEAAEAAAAQDAFWPMHDLLLAHQDELSEDDLVGYAEQLGLDVARFRTELLRGTYASAIAQDVETADLSNVSGTPTFFINGQRHYGAFDVRSLTEAIVTARDRARLDRPVAD